MAGTGTAHLRAAEDALLRVEDLVVEFPSRQGTVRAVSGISLDILPGETLGLVGESGCGKSTTGRAIIQMPRPRSGRVFFEGTNLAELARKRRPPRPDRVLTTLVAGPLLYAATMLLVGWPFDGLLPPLWVLIAGAVVGAIGMAVALWPPPAIREVRTRLQLIFQDPISSLNPRRRVRDLVREPLRIWKRGRRGDQEILVRQTLEAVGLDPNSAMDRRPHEFSGGQCQRISIARTLVMDPKLIICDEPVSALDVSVQAQILNLLEDLKARYGLTMVFIAHDLAVVKNVSDRIAVMYLGKICEVAPPDRLYSQPAHPYTEALLRSIPVPDPSVRPAEQEPLSGDLPSPIDPPSGCRFRTRCPYAQERCANEEPQIREVGPGHYVACHFPLSSGSVSPERVEVAAGAPA